MELFQSYPVAFIVTIVLPVITGLVLSIGGYDSLKARADSDTQLGRIEINTERALKQLPDISATLSTLNRYEQALAASGSRDEVLSAVLAQYKKMKQASDVWEQSRNSKNSEEKNQLAVEVLDILSTSLIPVLTPPNLPSNPLILGLGSNSFRVLFSVPMRIAPTLEFHNLPDKVQANVIEKSKFGFTVIFEPSTIPVSNFGFSANAEI